MAPHLGCDADDARPAPELTSDSNFPNIAARSAGSTDFAPQQPAVDTFRQGKRVPHLILVSDPFSTQESGNMIRRWIRRPTFAGAPAVQGLLPWSSSSVS
ncbi:hypothetical protein [Bradyrhizobium oligotrophicum]|uniref:hypothetical protein n=1 Tax=Bradyrhizobium oligotrophicum TaxID=44255 RepID=UPI003EB802AA